MQAIPRLTTLILTEGLIPDSHAIHGYKMVLSLFVMKSVKSFFVTLMVHTEPTSQTHQQMKELRSTVSKHIAEVSSLLVMNKSLFMRRLRAKMHHTEW